MDERLKAVAESAKGFMPSAEGEALYDAAVVGGAVGPLLEIGTYCGKSSVYLGAAARQAGTICYTIDHHRGSEEMQDGWEHHDTDLDDPRTGRMNSLPFFQQTIEAAGLEDVVVAIVGDSPTVAKHWTTPLGFVFIDGAHSEAPAQADYDGWVPKLVSGGVLAIHDVFENDQDGGQAPFHLYERARREGFVQIGAEGSLRVLRR